MLHNKIMEQHSIVQRLGCIDIFRIDGLLVLQQRDTGCYKSYIGRLLRQYRDDIPFTRGLTHVGVGGGCAYLNNWNKFDDVGYRTPCVSRPYLHPDSHFLGSLSALQYGLSRIQLHMSYYYKRLWVPNVWGLEKWLLTARKNAGIPVFKINTIFCM